MQDNHLSSRVESLFNRLVLSLLGFLACLLGLPIVILYFATAVPLWLSVSLTAIFLLGLGSALFLGFPPLLAVLVMLSSSVLAVWLSQRFASTPPIVDAEGKLVAGSIASLERVVLGGTEQWISLRGKSVQKPILLWLAGGPGSSDIALTRAHLQALEEHYLVVGWDQAGSVKSYRARAIQSLQPETYLSDAYDLIVYLRERFQQEKIYLLGHSWGTLLGVWLVQRYPECFHAYIAVAQYVNPKRNDELNFQFALDYLRREGKSKKLAILEKQGVPPYTDAKALVKYAAYMGEIANHTKSKLKDESKDTYTRISLDMLLAPEYGIIDKINIYRSAFTTFGMVSATILDLDLKKDAPCLDIPVYFAQGRWDMNCVASLAEDYYAILEAPAKRLVWFEHSGHLPQYEEKAEFLNLMIHEVLKKGSD